MKIILTVALFYILPPLHHLCKSPMASSQWHELILAAYMLPTQLQGLSPQLWMKFTFALLSVLVVCLKFYPLGSRQKLRLPPGPSRWPVLGNLLSVGALPHRDMHRMHQKYGPIVYLKLGSVNMVSINDPDVIRDVLITQDEIFASRPKTIATGYFCYDNKDLAFAPYGPHWKAIRRICLEHLLTTKRLQSFRLQRSDEAQNLVQSIWKDCKQGREIHLRNFVHGFSMNCLTRMLVDKRYYGQESSDPKDASSNFAHTLQDIFVMLGVFNVGDYLPFLRRFDLQGYEKTMKELYKNMEEFQNQILHEHKEKIKKKEHNANPNFVEVLLMLRENGEQILTDTVIKAIVEDLIGAGSDTSSVTTEWAMSELLRNGEYIRRAQAEVASVVGMDRMVEESDLAALPFLRRVVMETMRLRPAGPYVLPHSPERDASLAGLHIPAGTSILINMYSHARNTKVWGHDPPVEDFCPDRHKGDSTRIEMSCGADLKHIYFGGGRRRCPGASLGITMVMLMLARLLHSFDWTLPTGMTEKDIDMTESCGLTSARAIPLVAIATPRLASPLYTISSD